MFTDIVTIEPGQDITFCTYLDYVTDDILYVYDTLGTQTAHGHHAIMQYLTVRKSPARALALTTPISTHSSVKSSGAPAATATARSCYRRTW